MNNNIKQRGMPTDMETEVPARTQSSSNKKKQPQIRGNSKGKRSSTPFYNKNNNKKKTTNSNKKIMSKRQQLSLNSSWTSKRSRYSNNSNKTSGTMYTYLSQKQRNNNQKPKMCRFWRQNKCNREQCEFAHYELKHLNTAYNDCIKEGAQAINEVYHDKFLRNTALVQVTSLQFMTYEEIEKRMLNTLSYKEEIQIAITNKKAFQRFKQEYQKSCKALSDDSYKNKIQLKINVLKKYYESINNKKINQQKNNTQEQSNDALINQTTQNQTSPILIQISKGKTMENQQQQQKQQDMPLINNYTIMEIDQNKTKKRDKSKKEENINPNSRINAKMETEAKKVVDRKKSISKKIDNAKQTTNNKRTSESTPHKIYEDIDLKHSKKQTSFTPNIMEKANALTGIINQYRISDLNQVAIRTQANGNQLPENAQQRLFPPLMQANVQYSNYIIAQITNNQDEIKKIAQRLNLSQETKEKIKAKITIDASALYLFKVSTHYTTDDSKVDTMINNVAILATQKIKNILRDCLKIEIENVNNLGIRYILEYPLTKKEQINYYQDFIFNIGTAESQIMIIAEVQDVKSQQQNSKK